MSLPHSGARFEDPFPHVIANQFFDEQTYTELKTHLPDLSLYDRDRYHAQTERYGFWPHNKSLLKLPKTSQDFWQKISDEAGSSATTSRLVNFFEKEFSSIETLRSYLASGEPIARLRLVREKLPYTLPPHLDMDMKMLVIVIYLDREPIVSGNGTTLYIKEDEDFIPVKSAPFLPNHALITARIPDSWHGGSWQGEGYRDTLHIYYFPRSQEGKI